MGEPALRLSTWEDLWALPEGSRAEIIGGVIEMMSSPSSGHQGLILDLGGPLRGRFTGGRGGPGGWWILTDVDVELSRHDVVRPDLAGWRKERVPGRPECPIRDIPDWACEILSPSNARHDRLTKMDLYLRSGVEYVWLVDPELRLLEAYQRAGSKWSRIGAWADDPEAIIPPFDAVPLDLVSIFAELGPDPSRGR